MESSSLRSKIREIENDSGRLVEGGLDDDWRKEIAGAGFNGTCIELSLREAILKELLVHN